MSHSGGLDWILSHKNTRGILDSTVFCRAQVQVQVRSRSGEGQEGQKLT